MERKVTHGTPLGVDVGWRLGSFTMETGDLSFMLGLAFGFVQPAGVALA